MGTMGTDWSQLDTADPTSVYVIAEAGVNHNGDMDLARELVDAAVAAGADAVKFQTFRADRLVTPDAAQADYQTEQTETESQYEMLERYELSRAAHEDLQSYCQEQGITFLSTPFDPESADLLDDLGVPIIKLGSGELDNHPLLKHVAGLGRPIVLSTGMGTLEEVRRAREVIRAANPDVDLAVLHCTSCYPAAVEDVNLRAMGTLADELDTPVGYSDHTTAVETPAMAVAAGADIVEKHFTVDRSLPGPDHEASLEPDELDRAVTLARTAATARGSAVKEPTDAELENRAHIRKSLHAARDIPAGTPLAADDVRVLRPTDGLAPPHYDDVLGVELARDLEAGEPITPDTLSEDVR